MGHRRIEEVTRLRRHDLHAHSSEAIVPRPTCPLQFPTLSPLFVFTPVRVLSSCGGGVWLTVALWLSMHG